MASLRLKPTGLENLLRIQRDNFEDARGLFSRLYSREELEQIGGYSSLEQINYSRTFGQGSVRGMHFQYPPHAEAKIVTCVYGEVLDISIDLRTGSKTFLHHHAEKLSGRVLNSLLIPEGMAHGFQVLSDEAHMLYLHSRSYHLAAEGRVHPLDPAVKIDWALDVKNLSPRDQAIPFLSAGFTGVQF